MTPIRVQVMDSTHFSHMRGWLSKHVEAEYHLSENEIRHMIQSNDPWQNSDLTACVLSDPQVEFFGLRSSSQEASNWILVCLPE
jgi:hypothetical protein